VGGSELGELEHAVTGAERALVLHHSGAGARHPKRAELREVAPRRGLMVVVVRQLGSAGGHRGRREKGKERERGREK